MIAALFALAAAMTIAGLTAVVEGFPYVRLESGMAMVYGGSILGSCGLLLFGLAVIATSLRRIERSLRSAVLTDNAVAKPVEIRDPIANEFADIATLGAPSSAPSSDRSRIEPSLHLPAEPAPAAEPELPLPGLPPAPPARAERVAEPEPVTPFPAKATPEEDDLFVPSPPASRPESLPQPLPEPAAAERESDLMRNLREETAKPAPPVTPPPPPDRTVVGRYSSGGNTYMMYSDGAIEADTPNGRFTFASLDELKAFVDGGGEAGTRGAA